MAKSYKGANGATIPNSKVESQPNKQAPKVNTGVSGSAQVDMEDIGKKKSTEKSTKSSTKTSAKRKNVDKPQTGYVGPKDFAKSASDSSAKSNVVGSKNKILQDKNDMVGISKDRPVIVMMTDYKPIYQNDSSSYVGDYLRKQQGVRKIRLDIMEKIFSKIKAGDGNPLPKMRDYFDQGIDRVSENVETVFDVISQMNLLKDRLDLKDAIYNEDGKVSGKNIMVSILENFGYDTNSLQNEYSSTKLWFQFLIELKKTLKYSTLSNFEFTGQKISDNDPTTLFIQNQDYNFQQVSNYGTTTLSAFVEQNIEDAYSTIDQLMSKIRPSVESANSDIRSAASNISYLSKEYRCIKSLQDQGFVNFITKVYGFQNNPNVDFFNIFDNAIGNFGTDIFDMPDNNTNSLSSLAQIQNYVLTFENSYFTTNEKGGKLYTPGGMYYVDTLLNGNVDTYTANLTKLSSTFKEKKENFEKLINYLLPIKKPFKSANTDTFKFPQDFYDLLVDGFVDSTGNIKENFINDPFIVLLGHVRSKMGSNTTLVENYLVQFILYCVTGKKDKAKIVLDIIFTYVFGTVSVKWGGDDSVDEINLSTFLVDENKKAVNIVNTDINTPNQTWWEKSRPSFPNTYWLAGDVLYDQIYNMSIDTNENATSVVGKQFVDLMKSFISNLTNANFVGTKFTSHVNKFCMLCKITMTILNGLSTSHFSSFYTISNTSFGKVITEFTEFNNEGQAITGVTYISQATSEGQATTVKTGSEVSQAKLNAIKAQFSAPGNTRYAMSQFQVAMYSVNNVIDPKKITASVRSEIVKEIDFVQKMTVGVRGVLNAIIDTTDDLIEKIKSRKFQGLFGDLYYVENISPPNSTKPNDSTPSPSGLSIVGTSLQNMTNYSNNLINNQKSPFGNSATIGLSGGPSATSMLSGQAPGGSMSTNLFSADLSFFTKKQISLIASIVMDIKTKIANDKKIKSKVYVYPFDDVLYTKKLSDIFFGFFSKVGIDTETRYKVLSVGVPNGFSDNLKYKLSTTNKGNPKQNDVISINVYKIDDLNPDIIFRPISFLFETSRYPVKDSHYINSVIEGDMKNSSSIIKFINGFPTRNFDNLTSDELNKIEYYPDFTNDVSYGFLSENQKRKLYYNHAMSYLLEIYIKAITGISMSEAEFYSKQTYNYVNKGVLTQIKNIIDSAMQSESNPDMKKEIGDIVVDEWSRSMTSISDPVSISRNIFTSKKLERIFNLLIEPHKFEIDFEKTISTQQGKDAFGYLFAKNFINYNDSGEYVTTPSKSDVTMERFFVQIKTMNDEVI